MRKNKIWVAVLIAAALASQSPYHAFAEQEQSESGESVPIVNGELYEAVQKIEPGCELSRSSGGSVTFTVSQDDMDNDSVRVYFWHISQILALDEVKNEDSMMFALIGKDNGKARFATVSVNNFSGIQSDFSSMMFSMINDSDVDAIYKALYNAFFGAHTTENRMTMLEHGYDPVKYPVPDDYRNSYLWVTSHFLPGCGYQIDDSSSSISVQVPVEKTKEAGIAAGFELVYALRDYSSWLSADPDSLPYKTITVSYLGKDDLSKTIWSYSESCAKGAWAFSETTSGSGEFGEGIVAAVKAAHDTYGQSIIGGN